MRILSTSIIVTALIAGVTAQQAPPQAPAAAMTTAAAISLEMPEEDAVAVDEMLLGETGKQRRWVWRPALVIVSTVLQFEPGMRKDFTALDEQVAEADVLELVDDLTGGLALLTGGTFDAFASIRIEPAVSGASVRVARENTIVVARYRGVRSALNAVGFGGLTMLMDGTITSGTMILDSEYDRTDRLRHLLRIHELGHALGYNHVASRPSVMNPTLGSEPTPFDHRAARIAFSRPVVTQQAER